MSPDETDVPDKLWDTTDDLTETGGFLYETYNREEITLVFSRRRLKK